MSPIMAQTTDEIAERYLKLAYSPTEAADMLGRLAVRSAIADGLLIPRKVGVRSLIPADELLTWLRSHPPTPKQPRSVS